MVASSESWHSGVTWSGGGGGGGGSPQNSPQPNNNRSALEYRQAILLYIVLSIVVFE
jgi:hypothetical protein